MYQNSPYAFFFFFNDTATTEIYTLSLHDALPIYVRERLDVAIKVVELGPDEMRSKDSFMREAKALQELTHDHRSEEHTSELQSLAYLVCRLLLEKKN